MVLFGVDSAAISLVFDGSNVGTLGPAGCRHGCMTSCSSPWVRGRAWTRWPTARRWWWSIWPIPMLFGGRRMGRRCWRIRFAACTRCRWWWPASCGALDLFRAHPGVLGAEQLAGALVAAELAQMPLLDLLAEDLQAAVADPDSDSWAELNTLSRAEVSQATGMLVAQLEVEPAEALVRLRAHAFATGRSATDVACDILDRRLRLQAD